METFDKLHKFDEEFCKKAQTMTLSLLHVLSIFRKRHIGAKENFKIAGSIFEGAGISRLFKPNETFPDGLNREGEADVEVVILEIPETLKGCVHEIQNKPEYVNVKADDSILELATELGWNINKKKRDELLEIISDDGWLKTYKMKELSLKRNPVTKRTTKKLKSIIAFVLKKKFDEISITVDQAITKASIESNIMLYVSGQPFYNISYDSVTLIRLSWWPSIAQEWKDRKRNWPSQSFIYRISNICYIINKSSPEEKENQETLEMRYSFIFCSRGKRISAHA